MKKILLVTLISSFIVACGGGYGSSANATNNNLPSGDDLTQQCSDPSNCTEDELIDILKLPPEPKPGMPGFDTVKGIDSNGIRGRDDVELKVAIEFYKNTKDLNYFFDRSRANAEMTAMAKAVKEGKEGSKKEFTKLFQSIIDHQYCYISKYGLSSSEKLDKYEEFLFNTDERFIDYYVSEGYASDIKASKISESDCNKYFKR